MMRYDMLMFMLRLAVIGTLLLPSPDSVKGQAVDSVWQAHVRPPWYSRLNVYSDFSLIHYKSVNIGVMPGTIGGNGMAGFKRQPIGLGFEINLNYDILSGRRFVLGMGAGYRSQDRRYTVTDAAAVHNPDNQIQSYRYLTRIIEVPIYLKVKVFNRFYAGLRVQLPLLSSEGLISARENSSVSYFGKWGLSDFGDTQAEIFLSYGFRIKSIIIAPTISVGTPIYPSKIRFRPFSDVGIRINYRGNAR